MEFHVLYLLAHLIVIQTPCTAILPAVLLLFLPTVLVVVLSICDSPSLSSTSDVESASICDSLSLSSTCDVESVVKIGLVILLGCLVIFK